jgi:hypothetical protein
MEHNNRLQGSASRCVGIARFCHPSTILLLKVRTVAEACCVICAPVQPGAAAKLAYRRAMVASLERLP